MTRGILSIYWGDESKLPVDRLKTSLQKHHPELPHEIIKVEGAIEGPQALNIKADMFNMSPFDETLFLDIDTVVMGSLNFAFEKASEFGVAVSICESPWARRYNKLFTGDEVEYNTGVIFFTKKAKAIFDEWKNLAAKVDSSHVGVANGHTYTMPANDQASFALAIENLKYNPYVLPYNWNFRPKWHRSFCGPIKIWHDYVDPPKVFEEMMSYYREKQSIIQYHHD